MQTPRLNLVLQSLDDVRAMIAAMSPDDRAQLSADWLARVDASTEADPWVHGFAVTHRATGDVIGTAAFKGPPCEGLVEIAYAMEPEHQGQGYATEAAAALTEFAFASGRVCVVRAHTLPGPNASTRVLTKCGFRLLGEVLDPEDGLVWRWEKPQPASSLTDSSTS